MQLSVNEIAQRLGLSALKHECLITTLLTDSRSLENPDGVLFFAIPTLGNDGHRYIRDLYDRGVRNFVVNRIPQDMMEVDDVNWLMVTDTVQALQKTAARPDSFTGEILAITGSRGKTTLKEWIYQLMEPLSEISRSPRSFNSQIGVPLSLWGLSQSSSLGIIEAGISRPGEMQRLADIIAPDTVIFTNIGSPHSDGFASIKDKSQQKALLASADRVKCIIYPKDNEIISEALTPYIANKEIIAWSFTDQKAPLYLKTELLGDSTLFTYRFNGISSQFTAPVSSDSDIENCANALAFMLHSSIDRDVIAQRFANLHRIGTRLNVNEGVSGCSIILDSYTSDFSSLRPALDFMRRRRIPRQAATLILSDLHHESGAGSNEYSAIASLILSAGVSRFIGVGENLMSHRELFPQNSLFFRNSGELMQALSTSDFNDEIILLKGSPEYPLDVVADMLETRKHETVLEVNLDSLVTNYNYFRSKLPSQCGIICMVKAFGYGAGSYEIAKTLQDCGAAYLAVAVLDEGIELRRQGITMPVMVMNPKVMNYRSLFANRLEPEIYSFSLLRDMIAEAEKSGIKDYPIHIKLDTGMHRTGFTEEELPELIRVVQSTDTVKIASMFSHLATADCLDMDEFTHLQLSRFEQYTRTVMDAFDHPIKRHILNSAGILRFPEYHYDMARLGIGLYGANTLPESVEQPLAVVSTLRTVIINLRHYKPGETIGYGRRGVIDKPTTVATLPIGYADGMNRHFGRGAIDVIVNGHRAPTIGNICMDACMIDVTGIECNEGDSVEIFGKQATVQRLADTLDTIPYEILTSISPRVKRTYYRE